MPTLNDREIFEAHKNGELTIEPWNGANVQPGSIDLTLGDEIDVFDCPKKIDLGSDLKDTLKNYTKTEKTGGYELSPGEYVVGHSAEYIRLPLYINGAIFNRNSLARIGLDAGISQYINPGYHGNKIIVLRNHGTQTITLKSGIRICQLVLFRMGSESARSFDSRHDLDLIKEIAGEADNSGYDNSISAFMSKRIAEIAGGR